MRRQTPINTGDNRKKGEEVLINKAKQLQISRGCRPPKPSGIFTDSTGQRYAYKMKSKEGIYFFFVARSTKPYGSDHIVSIHKKRVQQARQEGAVIVMYWPAKLPKFSCEYNVFDPDLIWRATRGESVNIRLGEEMLNFMATLGICWPVNKSLEEMEIKVATNSLKWREWAGAMATVDGRQRRL